MSTELSKFIQNTMADKRISGYAVERATHGEISQSFVNRLKKGEVKTPSVAKLQILAKGLGVPEEQLLAAAGNHATETAKIVNAKLRAIDDAYTGLSKPAKAKVDFLIEILEREIARLG